MYEIEKKDRKNIDFILFSYKAALFLGRIFNITLHSLRVAHRTIVQWIQAYTIFLELPPTLLRLRSDELREVVNNGRVCLVFEHFNPISGALEVSSVSSLSSSILSY